MVFPLESCLQGVESTHVWELGTKEHCCAYAKLLNSAIRKNVSGLVNRRMCKPLWIESYAGILFVSRAGVSPAGLHGMRNAYAILGRASIRAGIRDVWRHGGGRYALRTGQCASVGTADLGCRGLRIVLDTILSGQCIAGRA